MSLGQTGDQNPVLPGTPVGSTSSQLLGALLCVFLQHFPGRLLRLCRAAAAPCKAAAVASCPLQNAIKENRAVVSGSSSDVASCQICLCHPGSSLAAARTFVDGIPGVLISCSRVRPSPPPPSFPNNIVSSLRRPLGVVFATAPDLPPVWDQHLPSSLATAGCDGGFA